MCGFVGLAIFALDVLVAGLCSISSSWSRVVFILAVLPLSCKIFFLQFFKGHYNWQDRDMHEVYVFSSYKAAVFFILDLGHEDI